MSFLSIWIWTYLIWRLNYGTSKQNVLTDYKMIKATWYSSLGWRPLPWLAHHGKPTMIMSPHAEGEKKAPVTLIKQWREREGKGWAAPMLNTSEQKTASTLLGPETCWILETCQHWSLVLHVVKKIPLYTIISILCCWCHITLYLVWGLWKKLLSW